MSDLNIVLTGFMGTGKTSVGREVAARLGRPFVDLDDLIGKRAGKRIPEIFAQDGEPAFRALEAEICQEMQTPAGLVVAAGGGAVLNPANRDALCAGGMVICLEATPEVIVRRLAGGNGRPLLSGPDRHTRIVELLAQRAEAYKGLPHHLDTSRLSIPQAAERVMGLAAGLPVGGHRMPVLLRPGSRDIERPLTERDLGTASSYDILIAEGLLNQVGRRLIAVGIKPSRCAVVTNPTVGEHWTAPLTASLTEAGFDVRLHEVPDGEVHKTLSTAGDLFARLAEDKLARDEPVIALGGGVIGDLAGFVAATWLRGVPLVQVPTSLLAMVDASVGGKVAVDMPQGKNLVGAFRQPALVLTDPQVLRTLPGAEFRAGLAEVVKAAIIGDAVLFEELAGAGPASLTAMIADAVRVKVRIVERDPFETGQRAWLNLGHTFGHALELVSGFSLRHGEAVALGMIAAAEMSAALSRCDRSVPVRVRRVIERMGLPLNYAFDVDAVVAAMGTDKKRRGRALRFVLPCKIGRVELFEAIPEADVRAALGMIRSVE